MFFSLRLLFVCFIAVSFFFNASNVMAYAPESVVMEWAANTEDFLGGYIAYRTTASNQYMFGGEASPNFIKKIPCGANDLTCATHTDLDLPAGLYFWVVTAYGTDGQESGPSNQVTHTVPDPPDIIPPENPTGLKLVPA